MTDLAKLARELKPYILPWLPGGAAGGASGSGGSLGAHELSGPLHTGTLAQSQAPWAATVSALQAHALNPNAHHMAATGSGAVAVSGTQVVSLNTPGGLSVSSANSAAGAHTHAIAASDTVSAAQTALLKATAGALTVATFGATTSVTTPSLLSSGTLTISPGTYAILSDGKSLRTSTFTSGFVGSGFRLDQGVSTAGRTTLEVDDLWVRGRMSVYELLIHQIRATNGSIFVSSTGKVTGIVDNGGGSYSFTCEAGHGFAGGDIIRAQRWNAASSSLYQTNMHVSYVPAPTLTEFTASLQSGDAPTVGMEFVRLGNLSVADRRGGIYMTADDSGAPFLDVFDDVNSLATWNTATALKLRLGNLQGYYGYGSRTYGLGAGTSGGTAVTVDSANGFRVMSGSTARFQADTSGNVYLRNASGANVISLLSSGASEFSGPMTLGALGGIYQGTGTFASPTTGLKIWNDSGVGRIGGYNAGTLQWYGSTNGRFYFAGGNGVLDASGISLYVPSYAVVDKWTDTATLRLSRAGAAGAGMTVYSAETTPKWAVGLMTTGYEAAEVAGGYGYPGMAGIAPSAGWVSMRSYGAAIRLASESFASNSGIELDATTITAMGAFAVTGISTLATVNASGAVTLTAAAPLLNVGSSAVSTGTCSLQIGDGRTGSGYAVFDMVGDTTYSDYGFRILRGNSGANTTTQIYHRGTGNFEWVAQDAAALLFKTAATTRVTIGSTGEVAIGGAVVSGWELYTYGDIGATGNIAASGVVTGTLRMAASSAPSTANDSSGSLGDLRYDGTYLYVRVSDTNPKWKRVTLNSW